MKKKVFVLSMLLLIVTGGVLTGCKNFLTGEDFLTQLENAISYANQESFNIRFSDKGGKISPSGDQPCRITDNITLIFTEDREKCFICWQVLQDGKVLPAEEASKYITFEDSKSPETKMAVNSRAENLTVQAKVAERPKIIKASPQSEAEGTFSGTNIEVLFSQDIDDSTIYFTEAELKELNISVSQATLVPGKTDCYYRYKTGDEETYVYKNITITDYIDTKKNYLKYFGIPQLNLENKKELTIPIVTPLPLTVKVMVTLSKNISSINENKNIGLSEDYIWTYSTNLGVDNEPPVFIDNPNVGFCITVADKGQTNYIERQCLSENIDDLLLFESGYVPTEDEIVRKRKVIPESFITNENPYLWVRGGFYDNDSGPLSLRWEVNAKKAVSRTLDNYDAIKDDIKKNCSGEIKLKTLGTYATINQELETSGKDIGGCLIDLSELLIPKLKNKPFRENVLYSITFIALDKNLNENKKTFYFYMRNNTLKSNPTSYSLKYEFKPNALYITNVLIPEEDSLENKNKVLGYGKMIYNGTEIAPGETYVIQGTYIANKSYTIPYQIYYITGQISDVITKELTYVPKKPKVGDIYYSDGTFYEDYDPLKTPVGIIYKATEFTDEGKTKYDTLIMDLEETQDSFKAMTANIISNMNYHEQDTSSSGYNNYNFILEKIKNIPEITITDTIWEYVINKNDSSNYVWFVPSKNEWEVIKSNKEVINSSIEKISTDYATKLGDDTKYFTSTQVTGNRSKFYCYNSNNSTAEKFEEIQSLSLQDDITLRCSTKVILLPQ